MLKAKSCKKTAKITAWPGAWSTFVNVVRIISIINWSIGRDARKSMSNNHVQEICTKGSLSIVKAFLTHSRPICDLPERMSRLYSDVSGLRSTRWVSYSSCTQYRCRESVSFPSSSLLRYLYILPTSVLWSLVAYCSASVLLVGVEA